MTQRSLRDAAADLDGLRTVNAHSWRAGVQLRAALRDGTPVCIRAVRPDDKERLRLAFDRLSPGTVFRRFFYRKGGLTSEELRMLTELDFRDHVSLAVTVDDQSGERLIAVSRFVRVAPAADRAELGVTVADEYQRRGAGKLLLQQLIALARRSGVRELVADVLDDNRDMLEVLQHLDVPAQRSLEHGICRVVLNLAARPPGMLSGELVGIVEPRGYIRCAAGSVGLPKSRRNADFSLTTRRAPIATLSP